MNVGPFIGLLLSVTLLLSMASCSRQSSNQLVVGMELSYPPFETVDQQGRPAGISVELAQDLAKALHREVRIENIPFDGLIPALQTAKIDLVISSMTATAERARSIDFSDAYLHTGLCLLINKSAPLQSITDADKPNITVAVKQGTTGQIYAREHLKNAHVLVLDKEDTCVLEVIQNKAQGFIYDQMSVFSHWRRNPDTTRAILIPFQEESWAIGMRKDSGELRTKVNEFLKSYRESGGFERLGDKWLPEQKAEFKKLGIPFFF